MSTPVKLYVYDLSNGVVKNISPFILGRRIEGVWHTSIVVFDNEYFYGGHGIACCIPGTTQLGQPLKQEDLGKTAITQDVFEDFLVGYSSTKFHGSSYNLLENNCNNFSDEVAKFLVGKGIDEDIVTLPQKVLSSPMGPFLRSHLEKMSNVAPTDAHNTRNLSSNQGNHPGNGHVCPGNGHIHSHTGQPRTMPAYTHQQQWASGADSSVPQWARGADSSVIYTVEFSSVSLDTEDVEILQQADTLLPTVISHGPLSAEDLPLLVAVRGANVHVFCKVIALLCNKPGFIRLLLADKELYKHVLLEVQPDRPRLSNNLIAGLNHAQKDNKHLIEKVLSQISAKILSDDESDPEKSFLYARSAYNLCGCTLNEEQVIELGSALLHTLPTTLEHLYIPVDCSTNATHTHKHPDNNLSDNTPDSGLGSSDETVQDSGKQTGEEAADSEKGELPRSEKGVLARLTADKLRLLLKSVFLLMLKNRQVVDLCTAMEKDFEIFYVHSDLKPIAAKIVQLKS